MRSMLFSGVLGSVGRRTRVLWGGAIMGSEDFGMMWLGDFEDFHVDFVVDSRSSGVHITNVDPALLVPVTDSVESEMIEFAITGMWEVCNNVADFYVGKGFESWWKEEDVD